MDDRRDGDARNDRARVQPANRKRARLDDGRPRCAGQEREAGRLNASRCGEQLREEESVGGTEIRPLAQILARIVDTVAFHGEGPQGEIVLSVEDGGQFGIELASPNSDGVDNLGAGQGGDVVGADVFELDQVHQRTGDSALI